jgi:signal transduction histidine kinase
MWRLTLPRRLNGPSGLAARLLLAVAVFVAVAEAFILLPALAGFHERWLSERVRAAELVSLAVEAAPENVVPDDLASQLLEGAGVASVAIQEEGARRLLLAAPRMEEAPELVDLRRGRSVGWLVAPWRTLVGEPERMVRVVSRPRFRTGDFVEIVVPARPLQLELRDYMVRSLLLSVALTVAGGGLVFLALSLFIVRPMRRVTASIEQFREDPERPGLPPPERTRRDEIGRVEAELARMQEEVRQALRSRARLAALGEAVAKISHDLRNMLTSAQMASDRLADARDPVVAKAMPRLERALDRALRLAQNVLSYGRSEEPPAQLLPTPLRLAVEAAAEDAGLSTTSVPLETDLAPALQVMADGDQLHRLLVNLMRNARQAIEMDPDRRSRRPRGHVWVRAEPQPDGTTLIHLADDGPGLPERIRERLFLPFAGSSSEGGAGLGLAIAHELALAQGGDLALEDSSPQGVTFALRLITAPDGAVAEPA